MGIKEIIDKVRVAGVVGAGGAGFPTHVKLSATDVDCIIVNGAECEPLIRVDQQLMELYGQQLSYTLERIVKALGATKGVFALKGKHKKAVQALKDSVKNRPIEVFEMGDYYPAGDEQVMVYEVTGRIVPEGGIPLMVGCIVINVETLLNVYHALNDKPVTSKYVTVTGMVKNPVTVHVPVGVSFSQLIEEAGGATVDDYVVVDGGPMMGGITENLTQPVTKTTKAIIVLAKDHCLVMKKNINLDVAIKRSMSVCCQCRFCTDMCPRNLLGHSIEPHKVLRSVGYEISYDANAITQSFLCSECGVCDLFACTMDLSPRLMNKALKQKLSEHGIDNPHKNGDLQVKFNRDYVKIPVSRLISRLGLESLNVSAPIQEGIISAKTVELPLKQHVGAPCKPIVNNGDLVKTGDAIGQLPEGALGARLHASIDGTAKVHGSTIVIEK